MVILGLVRILIWVLTIKLSLVNSLHTRLLVVPYIYITYLHLYVLNKHNYEKTDIIAVYMVCMYSVMLVGEMSTEKKKILKKEYACDNVKDLNLRPETGNYIIF